VTAGEAASRRGRDLRTRYTVADLDALSAEEARRFLNGGVGDPQRDLPLAWELLYRLEPELYDRLASAERLHRALLEWLPSGVGRIVEVGAGSGRLTLELLDRAREIVAIEPAQPLREILAQKLSEAEHGDRVRVAAGFFDELPLPDAWSDVVVACSAFTRAPGHGGDAGLAEMERVCKPAGCVAILWPNSVGWLEAHGYRHLSFAGEMFVEFASAEDAAELAEIFYPAAAAEVRRRGEQRVSFDTLGINPPRDVAFKVMAA
jgi:ubiquinone/menaquinone biosynthesis C-methylase UbiE